MAIRRTLRSALSIFALTAALGLTACGGNADAGASPSASGAAGTSSGTPTPAVDTRPTPASSTGPARNLPKPEMPAAARENTKAGFEAFTQYWFDTVTYALETGDAEPLRAISKPDCKICNGYLVRATNVSTGDGWESAPRWAVRDFTSTLKLDPLGQAVGYFIMDESASTRFGKTGEVLKTYEQTSGNEPRAIYAIHDGIGWKTAQAGNA
ncbi:DUF6318 family protein [Sinomonas sp. ASV486]|uniref:DUF6318 family protein n=1 Tax=Sinomonas sp. ASV486 TaxID=3051170 RepID=UPI0027DD7933|nr:DUF6318 family protein [Sinomonas sp. ASV486]MDQ4489089.1 DUF6318 family protein [Sinomonas sp. ASV486]